jgi:hypothetical protein
MSMVLLGLLTRLAVKYPGHIACPARRTSISVGMGLTVAGELCVQECGMS